MTALVLSVGGKTYSSWPLRAWLALAWSGLPFEERPIQLDAPGYGLGAIAEVVAVSPSARVPALSIDAVTIWDSLAIAEWVAEAAPEAGLWPDDPMERALARSLTAGMHAGLAGLRRERPCNLRRRTSFPPHLPEDARADLARIDAIFASQPERAEGRGPYLFGRRGVVDAFCLPVATRLRTFDAPCVGAAAAYRDTLLADEAYQHWERDAAAT